MQLHQKKYIATKPFSVLYTILFILSLFFVLLDAEMVEAKICNKRCPQNVISFYEDRVHWASDSESSSEDELENRENIAIKK